MSAVNMFSIRVLWLRYCVCILFLIWILGLFLGVCSGGQGSSSDLLHQAVLERPSYVVLIGVGVIPLLICSAALYFSASAVMLPVVFLKSFSFGYITSFVSHTFGSASWLVTLMFLFTDIYAALALLYFSFRHIRGGKDALCRDAVLLSSFCLVAATVDYLFISPFLMDIMYHS